MVVAAYLVANGGPADTATRAGEATASPTVARTPTAHATATVAATGTPIARTGTSTAAGGSGLKTIHRADLPKEAQATLALIAQGGPYPYDRDGVVFENRERILPRQASGYYHEYTVVTPGSDDRGARRIVTGKAGELFYTDDHYASFREVIP